VQNVSVTDGGKAIVGNVTQHAERDRVGKEPGIRGAEGAEEPGLQTTARFH